MINQWTTVINCLCDLHPAITPTVMAL